MLTWKSGKTLAQVDNMLHVLFRFYPRRPVPSIQQAGSQYSKPVRLVGLHLSFHGDLFHCFFFSFLFLTTMAFLRRLMSLRLSWCVGKAVAAAEGTSHCLLLHTRTHTHTHTHTILLSKKDSRVPEVFLSWPPACENVIS